MEKTLIFIHGFLGQARDWQPAIEHLKLPTRNYCLDLNQDFELKDLSFSRWPEAFENWLHKNGLQRPWIPVGYSLGGRLIFPLLEKGLCHQALFLSPHPGLAERATTERLQRNRVNQEWAQRFLHEPWAKVIEDWNRQEVFKGSSSETQRDESEFEKIRLAQLLTGFSLGDQKDYSRLLDRENFRGLYLAGEDDTRYSQLALRLQQDHPRLKVKLIKNSGHRLLFDQPLAVAREISEFLEQSD